MKNYKHSYLLKHLFIAILFVNGYINFFYKGYSFVNLSNSLTIFGLIYLILGLFRLVKASGFFDLSIYGFKKVYEVIKTKGYSGKESELGDYMDFLEKNEHKKSYLEFLIVGFLLLLLSILIVVIYKP